MARRAMPAQSCGLFGVRSRRKRNLFIRERFGTLICICCLHQIRAAGGKESQFIMYRGFSSFHYGICCCRWTAIITYRQTAICHRRYSYLATGRYAPTGTMTKRCTTSASNMLAELTTTNITKEEHPITIDEHSQAAARGGSVARSKGDHWLAYLQKFISQKYDDCPMAVITMCHTSKLDSNYPLYFQP